MADENLKAGCARSDVALGRARDMTVDEIAAQRIASDRTS
jgi:hypothetical protein